MMEFFDKNGRRVSSDEWSRGLISDAVDEVIEQYKETAIRNVSTMRCPIHGGQAELTFIVHEQVSDQLAIDIRATSCCDEFSQQAVNVAQNSWGQD